jgi:hypothetical protein
MRINSFLFSVVLAFGVGSLPACGDDPNLSGSQCTLLECSYDVLTCQYYPSSHDYKIYYKRSLDEGFEYTAIIVINTKGLDPVAGTHIEDKAEFIQRVNIYRPDSEDWPNFSGGELSLDTAGQNTEEVLAGYVSFQFDNGRFLLAKFNCPVETAQSK